MAFLGSAGTGKTTMARIIAKILTKAGYTNGRFIEVQRQDLIHHNVGKTGQKTQSVINAASKVELSIDRWGHGGEIPKWIKPKFLETYTRLSAIEQEIKALGTVEIGSTAARRLELRLEREKLQTTFKKIQKIMLAPGILFVDEAYRLAPPGKDKDFGPEALEELMRVMLSHNPIMMFAGYKKKMEDFFNVNQGLSRRIPVRFPFEDLTTSEIAKIICLKLNKSDYFIEGYDKEINYQDNETLVSKIEDMLEALTTKNQMSTINGDAGRLIKDTALESQEKRLFPSIERLMEEVRGGDEEVARAAEIEVFTLHFNDIQDGICQLPPPKTNPKYSSVSDCKKVNTKEIGRKRKKRSRERARHAPQSLDNILGRLNADLDVVNTKIATRKAAANWLKKLSKREAEKRREEAQKPTNEEDLKLLTRRRELKSQIAQLTNRQEQVGVERAATKITAAYRGRKGRRKAAKKKAAQQQQKQSPPPTPTQLKK